MCHRHRDTATCHMPHATVQIYHTASKQTKMARVKQTILLGLILLTSVAAFGHTAARNLRPLSKSPQYPLHRLHAEPSPDELGNKSTVTAASGTPPSAYDEGDPRQALEQFGSLFSQVQAILTEGDSWDSDELEDKTREFVRSYVGVVVPGVGYVATSVAVYASSFAFVRVALALSGRGYTDIVASVSGFEPLRDLLEKADPAWGNTAIALVILEILSPAIIAVTLALTPKTMDSLRTTLDGWGWGEEGINERVSEMLGK
mmetsp:Transcript_15537/g.33638  ORF Transcript_15537/g.33638 Transcript_15537/m.33638 type:complete len:260 (-) Transcript_15537:845-1624(-)